MKTKGAEAVSKVALAGRKRAIVSGMIISLSFILTLILGAYLILEHNTKTSRDNVYTMNAQLEKSVTAKLEKLQSVSQRVFQRSEFVEHDASVYEHGNSYEAFKLEKEIEDYLYSLSTIDNYNDFFFLYANNHTVGRVSKSANEAFGKDMYEKVCSCLKNKKSAWVTGLNGDFARIYHVRYINSGTVFVGSMLTDELKTIFPDVQGDNLSFALVDDAGEIIYSTNENGVLLDAIKRLKNEWSDGEPVTIDSLKYAANSMSCGDSWHIISVTNFAARNEKYLRIFLFCAAIMAGVVIIVLFLGYLLSLSKMPDNIIYRGEYAANNLDRLTGLIMNEALENVIIGKIDSCINGATMVLLLVRIKNYQLISENYGESAVGEATVKVADVLREFYGKNNTVGKTGDDEFAVLADFTDFNLFKAHERMKANIRQLEDELDKLELENERGMIRCALGAAIYPDDSDDYDTLYENAMAALDDSAQLKACKCRFFKDISGGSDKK